MQATLWQLGLVPACTTAAQQILLPSALHGGTCNLIMAEQHAGRLAGRGAPEAAGKKAAAHLCIPSTAGLPCTLAVQQTLLPSVLPERPGA